MIARIRRWISDLWDRYIDTPIVNAINTTEDES